MYGAVNGIISRKHGRLRKITDDIWRKHGENPMKMRQAAEFTV